MARLAGHGIEAYLPDGFEGRIYRRSDSGMAQAYPVMHFATFPLPSDTADFGGGVPAGMGPGDIFGVLFQYGPESLGKSLFARKGMPRDLTVNDFRTYTLRRGVAGQSGTQWFFTEADKPFTLYVVLGSHALRTRLVPRVNLLLRQISIAPGVLSANPTPGHAGATP